MHKQSADTKKLPDMEAKKLKKVLLTELAKVQKEISRLKSVQAKQDQQEKEKELSNEEITKRLARLNNAKFHLNRQLRDLSEDNPEEIVQLTQKVTSNDPKAMHALAKFYIFGQGVNKNNEKGKQLLDAAVELQYSPAITSLGVLYREGIYFPQDVLKAEEYFKKAVALNDSRAMVKLAQLYIDQAVQNKTRKNNEQVKTLLESAIALNNTEAVIELAKLYLTGEGGVHQNLDLAITLLLPEAKDNNSTALYMLGRLYSGIDGYIYPAPNEAQQYYEKAVKLGHRDAMVELATLLMSNKGDWEINWVPVVALWQKAAKLGDSSALKYLGDIYQFKGIYTKYGNFMRVPTTNPNPNLVKAKENYEKAVTLGNTEAMLNLGKLYEKQNDHSTAAKLYADAYKLGNVYAESSLLEMSGPGKAEAAYQLALIKDSSSFSIFSSSKETQLINALLAMEPDKAIKRLKQCWEENFISSDNALVALKSIQKKASNLEAKNLSNFYFPKFSLLPKNNSDQKKPFTTETKNAINFLFATIYLAQGNISKAKEYLDNIEDKGIGLSGEQLHEIGQFYLNLVKSPEKAQPFLKAAIKAGVKGAKIDLEMLKKSDDETAQVEPDMKEGDESTASTESNPLSQLITPLAELRKLLPKMVLGERRKIMDGSISDFLITLAKHLHPKGNSLSHHAPEVNLLAQLTNVLDVYDICSKSEISEKTRSIFDGLLNLVGSENNKEDGISTIILAITELTELLDKQDAKFNQITALLSGKNQNYSLPFFSKADKLKPLIEIVDDKNLFVYEKLQRLEKVLSSDHSSNNPLQISQQLRAQLLEIITSQEEKPAISYAQQS
jgi:TPR repeat protein